MRKINRPNVAKMMLVLVLIASIGVAFGSVGVGRFAPTHMIVKPVYCGSCHPEEIGELYKTTHIQNFARDIENAVYTATQTATGTGTYIPSADAISKACEMCHNYWDNFKWFGVRNFSVSVIESDNPNISTVVNTGTDIYGNAVSPYGLGSTKSYMANVSSLSDSITYHRNMPLDVEPWTAGLDAYMWKNTTTNVSRYRLDYVWSQLSALSPGPVAWQVIGQNPSNTQGCGSAEKGMCHIAVGAVVSEALKQEIPNYPQGSNVTWDSWNFYMGNVAPSLWTTGPFPPSIATTGVGEYFTHEMAYTSAQYAAKSVKLCGSCHVFKLPPMRWGGTPWAISDIESVSANGINATNTNPFGFGPTYNDLIGEGLISANMTTNWGNSTPNWLIFRVEYKTPDWAHENVPCVRCHSHAGINGETVSNNIPQNATSPGTPSPVGNSRSIIGTGP